MQTSTTEPVSFDEIIDRAGTLCTVLAPPYAIYGAQIAELRQRLAGGRMHLAVLGQFNRGKSTFINALLGLDILPVSVLPLTTVATIIKYGAEESVTIEFLDRKLPIVARKTRAELRQVLEQYVTEDKNPVNQYNVKEAVVTCASPLLENGTVVLDTPGFGSTHVHNTKTTLDLLADCDAALFMLSADPPITQTESEFLKLIMPRLPRIFFILNKVDLIDPAELSKTDHFIRSVLIRKHGAVHDVAIFPVCARAALKAVAHTAQDSTWVKSGMERVQREIIQFLQQDKYFALAEALTSKAREAIGGVTAQLRRDYDQCTALCNHLLEDGKALQALQERIGKKNQQERDLIPHERSAMDEFCKPLLSQKREMIVVRLEQALCDLVAHGKGSDPVKSIRSALPALWRELFALAGMQLTAALHKPLRKALAGHSREFEVQLADAKAVNSHSAFENTLVWDGVFDREIVPVVDSSESLLDNIRFGAGARFASYARKTELFVQQMQPVIAAIVEQNMRHLATAVEDSLNDYCASLRQRIDHDYSVLQSQTTAAIQETSREYQTEQAAIVERSSELQRLKNEFEGLLNQLPAKKN